MHSSVKKANYKIQEIYTQPNKSYPLDPSRLKAVNRSKKELRIATKE